MATPLVAGKQIELKLFKISEVVAKFVEQKDLQFYCQFFKILKNEKYYLEASEAGKDEIP